MSTTEARKHHKMEGWMAIWRHVIKTYRKKNMKADELPNRNKKMKADDLSTSLIESDILPKLPLQICKTETPHKKTTEMVARDIILSLIESKILGSCETETPHKKTEMEAREILLSLIESKLLGSCENETPHKKTEMEAREIPLSVIESNILPRVPAKTIGRCRCVCKRWGSFLSNPMFAREHIRRLTIDDYNLLILDNNQPAVTFRTLSLNGDSKPIRSIHIPEFSADFVLASLDGLVCLVSVKTSKLAFWNPLTGAYKILSSNPSFRFNSFNIPFDAVGFYMDSSSDYKLLYLIMGGRFGAYVYSHRLDSWRKIEFLVGSKAPCSWSQAISCYPCLYFTVSDMSSESQSWIVCFDVETEAFRKIRFPHVPSDARSYRGSLVVLNQCVHLCVSYTILTSDYRYLKQGDLWRIDGDDGCVKVAAYSDALSNDFERQHICTASTRNWLAVSDENSYFKKMNAEDFARDYWYFCSPSWEYRSSRMIYVETLVSPNP